METFKCLLVRTESAEVCCLVWIFPGFPPGTVVKKPPANAGDTRHVGSVPGSVRWSRKWHACVLSHFSHVQLFATLWTAHQAPLSTGFSRQEYWSGLPCPPPRDPPNPGIEPASLMSPALAGGFLNASATWEAQEMATCSCVLTWRIPWREEPGRLQSVGVTKSQT